MDVARFIYDLDKVSADKEAARLHGASAARSADDSDDQPLKPRQCSWERVVACQSPVSGFNGLGVRSMAAVRVGGFWHTLEVPLPYTWHY